MAAPSRVALADPSLVRGWLLDVDSGYPSGTPNTWIAVSGVQSFKVGTNPTRKETTTFDDQGAQSMTKTAQLWKIEFKVKRAPQLLSTAAYDPGQEKLRLASLQLGTLNSVHVRWYEYNGAGYPLTEAWEGYAGVDWDEDADASDDPRAIQVTLTGRGARTPSTFNPASA